MASDDPYNLQRFIDAQNPIFEKVCSELGAGYKRSHWIWFIFPQIQGLAHSPTATYFAISSIEEARAYLLHPVLGPRLRVCTALVNDLADRTIAQIFGYPDHLKFRSSMTLFAHATKDSQLFRDALEKYFDGVSDPLTLARL